MELVVVWVKKARAMPTMIRRAAAAATMGQRRRLIRATGTGVGRGPVVLRGEPEGRGAVERDIFAILQYRRREERGDCNNNVRKTLLMHVNEGDLETGFEGT